MKTIYFYAVGILPGRWETAYETRGEESQFSRTQALTWAWLRDAIAVFSDDEKEGER